MFRARRIRRRIARRERRAHRLLAIRRRREAIRAAKRKMLKMKRKCFNLRGIRLNSLQREFLHKLKVERKRLAERLRAIREKKD